MRVAEASCYAYELPLRSPVRVARETLTARRGWLVRVRCTNGAEGWGDAAPLPGFSRETERQALRDLQRMVPALTDSEWPDHFADLKIGTDVVEAASVRFAVECAVWQAMSGDSPASSLWRSPAVVVPVCALLTGTDQAVLARAGAAVEEGCRAAKLKVGRQAPALDAGLVRNVRAILGGQVELRLDANRAWTIEEARTFAREADGCDVAWVEEPLSDSSQLSVFQERTGLAFALDETLQEGAPPDVWSWPGLRAVVLKPTLLGGVKPFLMWKCEAERRGVSVVASSAFESGVGVRALGWLASGCSDVAAGLDTYRSLEKDVLSPRLSLDGSELDLAAAAGCQVDFDVVRRIL